MHHIQKHILKILTYQATARFSELRPSRVDTSLFSYHLKSLLRSGLVAKDERTYSLSADGLLYVDRISSERFEVRAQPKIMTATVLRDLTGRIVLMRRSKQPFIDRWGLPSGKLHLDESIYEAAGREVMEKTGAAVDGLQHVGDGYVHAFVEDRLVSSVLIHVFTGGLADESCLEAGEWVAWPDTARALMPGTSALIEKALTAQRQRFFVELEERC